MNIGKFFGKKRRWTDKPTPTDRVSAGAQSKTMLPLPPDAGQPFVRTSRDIPERTTNVSERPQKGYYGEDSSVTPSEPVVVTGPTETVFEKQAKNVIRTPVPVPLPEIDESMFQPEEHETNSVNDSIDSAVEEELIHVPLSWDEVETPTAPDSRHTNPAYIPPEVFRPDRIRGASRVLRAKAEDAHAMVQRKGPSISTPVGPITTDDLEFAPMKSRLPQEWVKTVYALSPDFPFVEASVSRAIGNILPGIEIPWSYMSQEVERCEELLRESIHNKIDDETLEDIFQSGEEILQERFNQGKLPAGQIFKYARRRWEGTNLVYELLADESNDHDSTQDIVAERLQPVEIEIEYDTNPELTTPQVTDKLESASLPQRMKAAIRAMDKYGPETMNNLSTEEVAQRLKVKAGDLRKERDLLYERQKEQEIITTFESREEEAVNENKQRQREIVDAFEKTEIHYRNRDKEINWEFAAHELLHRDAPLEHRFRCAIQSYDRNNKIGSQLALGDIAYTFQVDEEELEAAVDSSHLLDSLTKEEKRAWRREEVAAYVALGAVEKQGLEQIAKKYDCSLSTVRHDIIVNKVEDWAEQESLVDEERRVFVEQHIQLYEDAELKPELSRIAKRNNCTVATIKKDIEIIEERQATQALQREREYQAPSR